MGLCAMGIGMAKTGLGGLGMVVVPVMANIFGAKSSTGILLLLLIMADFFGVRYYHMHAGDILSDEYFRLLLATVIVACAGMMIIKINIKENKIFSTIVGFLGGFITMIGNAAGPIMSIYFLSMGFDKNKFIGTAAWFFLFVNLFKVPLHVFIWGTIDLDIFLFDLTLFPLILLGALAGVWIVKKIPERPYKIFVIISVILSTFNLFI